MGDKRFSMYRHSANKRELMLTIALPSRFDLLALSSLLVVVVNVFRIMTVNTVVVGVISNIN